MNQSTISLCTVTCAAFPSGDDREHDINVDHRDVAQDRDKGDTLVQTTSSPAS